MATYDIDALKADLPTAKDLARFVYDKTGLSLDLIGKPKEEQYLAAKNALEGKKVPSEFLNADNPYVEKSDLIPEDPLPPVPKRDEGIPDEESRIHTFVGTNMPHPTDPQSDRKVMIRFNKYDSGMITYYILGPIEKQAIGSRINKFGQNVPERYSWLDPRTGEAVLRRADGTFTKDGRGLYAFCSGEKGAGIWSLIDRNLISVSEKNIANPWA